MGIYKVSIPQTAPECKAGFGAPFLRGRAPHRPCRFDTVAPRLLSWKKHGPATRAPARCRGPRRAFYARNTAFAHAAPLFAPLCARRCAGHVRRLGQRCRRCPLYALAAAQQRGRNARPAGRVGRAVCARQLLQLGRCAPGRRRADGRHWRRARRGRRRPAGAGLMPWAAAIGGTAMPPRRWPLWCAICSKARGRPRWPAAMRTKTPPAAASCASAAFAIRTTAFTTNTTARPCPAAITC